jgi:renalase
VSDDTRPNGGAHCDVIVVGAGMAGLTAAHALVDADRTVIILDKGRSVGGRLATRRMAGARLDHGAQFFTVRTPAFAARVADWERRGLAHVWCHGFGAGSGDTTSPSATAAGDGHPRWVGTFGMNALAKDLATGLDVRVDHRVFSTERTDDVWTVTCDDASTFTADALVLTAPVAQSFSMVFETVEDLPRAVFDADYDRTLGLLAVLDRPSAVPAPGGVQRPSPEIAWVADNAAKGISEVPALTVHASPDWSEQHWDTPEDEVHALLLELSAGWIGDATVVDSQVKRWRFATPRHPWPDQCWVSQKHRLVLAGDAFAGPRVEGAHTSGLVAATTVTELLSADR